MATMPNAPVCYTLAMMRFPKVINIEKFVGEFQDHIRKEYPLQQEQVVQGLEFVLGEEGQNFRTLNEKFWQFTDLDREHALLLGSEFLVLHAGRKYGGHEDFIGRFGRATDALCMVEGFSTVMTALGYRYIDLVVPDHGAKETLRDYVEPWVMSSCPDGMPQELRLVDSAFIAGFQTSQGILRFQALRNPPVTLPLELDTPLVRGNDWVVERPEGEFAMLDLDHAALFPTPLSIESGKVMDELNALRGPAAELFALAVTPYAIKVWNSEKPNGAER